ncbi:MAG: hypothetical protein AAF682_27885 [Planctomycetota bacterium]
MRLQLLLVPLLLSSCTLFESEVEEPRTWLPEDWNTLEPYAFEGLLERSFPVADPAVVEARAAATELPPDHHPLAGTGTGIVRFNRVGYDALESALDGMDVTSVRAALLLAHSRHRGSGERLVRRLEQREVGPTRGADSGDVIAAAAMAGFPEAERWRERLVELAVGGDPHPDLEVRVECACTVLALGDDGPIEFLLQVLRIDTYAGATEERDFEPSIFTAWARGRAAVALSRRAGVPVTYQPDGSIADREREANRLEGLLRNETRQP